MAKEIESIQNTYFWAAIEYFYRKRDKFKNQLQLAKAAGIWQSQVSEFLKKERGGNQVTQEKIAKAFGFELQEFLDEGQKLVEMKSDQNSPLHEPDIIPLQTRQFWAALQHFLASSKKYKTQSDLANASGVGRAYIGALVRQERSGTEKTQEKIARAFGFELQDFLDFGRKLIEQAEPIPEPEPTAPPDPPDPAPAAPEVDAALLAVLNDPKIRNIARMLNDLSPEDVSDIQRSVDEKIRLREAEKEIKKLRKAVNE